MATATTVSLNRLINIALHREIPSDLEKTYTKKTGINPVAIALRCREARLMFGIRFIASLAGIAIFLSTVVVIFDVSSMVREAERTAFWWTFSGLQATLLVGVIYALWDLPTSFFGRVYSEVKPFPEEITIAKEFCADLSYFCDLGRIDPINLVAIGFDRLKKHADTILVTEANLVLAHDKTNEDISFKYDTLLRLGLVEPGGYKKYFTKAREQLASRT